MKQLISVDDVFHQGERMCERVLLRQEQADLHGDGEVCGELAVDGSKLAFVTVKGHGTRAAPRRSSWRSLPRSACVHF